MAHERKCNPPFIRNKAVGYAFRLR